MEQRFSFTLPIHDVHISFEYFSQVKIQGIPIISEMLFQYLKIMSELSDFIFSSLTTFISSTNCSVSNECARV